MRPRSFLFALLFVLKKQVVSLDESIQEASSRIRNLNERTSRIVRCMEWRLSCQDTDACRRKHGCMFSHRFPIQRNVSQKYLTGSTVSHVAYFRSHPFVLSIFLFLSYSLNKFSVVIFSIFIAKNFYIDCKDFFWFSGYIIKNIYAFIHDHICNKIVGTWERILEKINKLQKINYL